MRNADTLHVGFAFKDRLYHIFIEFRQPQPVVVDVDPHIVIPRNLS